MSGHNVCFYGEIRNITSELLSDNLSSSPGLDFDDAYEILSVNFP